MRRITTTASFLGIETPFSVSGSVLALALVWRKRNIFVLNLLTCVAAMCSDTRMLTEISEVPTHETNDVCGLTHDRIAFSNTSMSTHLGHLSVALGLLKGGLRI